MPSPLVDLRLESFSVKFFFVFADLNYHRALAEAQTEAVIKFLITFIMQKFYLRLTIFDVWTSVKC